MPHFCRKSANQDISATDLIMFGMYRFTPEQEKIYQDFVNMLSEFNRFDMVKTFFFVFFFFISISTWF